ncbi:MAG: glycosyltransferase family 4 protein [Candidatus Sumerlaeia bacterium]|nr:glycosyltransferase family 4 protein [Candidatus Sumerlaeia bacterium]
MKPRSWLFFNYEFPPVGGGGGTCSMYLAKELARAGHRVVVLTAAFGELPRREERDGYLVRRIPALRAMAGQCRPYEMASYAASAFFSALFRGRRPDYLASFHSIPSGMPAWPLSVLWGRPHFVLFQGGDVPGWLPGELEKMHARTLWLNRLIVHQSALALANSDGLRDLAQPSFPKKRIGVLYGGADPDVYAPPESPREGRTGPCRFLFVGRLTTQKGLDTLLRALAAARREDPGLEWSLDVAGDGPRRGEFEEIARRESLTDRVVFHGFVDRSQGRLLYDAADVFAFPSRYEGMPNVVLEAMACGLPVIGTRIAGTEQLVEPGVNGELLAVDDTGALAGACLRLARDRALRTKMGGASRALVLEKWTWAARAAELARLAEAEGRAHRQGAER